MIRGRLTGDRDARLGDDCPEDGSSETGPTCGHGGGRVKASEGHWQVMESEVRL